MVHPYIPMLRIARFVEILVRERVLDERAAADLDFPRLERIPDERVPPRTRYADVAWVVPLRRPVPHGPTHAVVLFKCESAVRADAGDRLQRHRESLARAFDRARAYGHPARPVRFVPVVLYSGEAAWDAPGVIRPAAEAPRHATTARPVRIHNRMPPNPTTEPPSKTGL